MEHIVGTINSIALQDFLTYNQAFFRPGKHLNVIIGPNGSGKSTVVAGIILGCGGKPSVLSRSKDISDYVKNGKDRAIIEIELVKNTQGDTITLNRAFDKNGRELFKVDGAKVSAKAYVEKVQSFNIQVDNLCMFLPQDRVQDFTKLNAQEILHNTQISVCSAETNESFEALKTKREKQKNCAKQNNDLQIQLEDNINRNEQLHGMIQNSQLRERLAKEIEDCKRKKAWVDYEAFKKEFDEADGDVKKLKESIDKKKHALKPLEKRQTEIAGTKTALKNAISKADTKLCQTSNSIEKMLEASSNLESDIGKARQAFKNTIASAQNHEKEIRDLDLLVELQKKEFEEARDVLNADGDCDQMSKQFDVDIQNHRNKIDGVMQEVQNLNGMLDDQIVPSINYANRKIEIMQDTQRQRFNVLRTQFEDAYRAYQWLEANRNSFRGTIFNPVMTEITVKDKQFAKYLENTVAVRDLEMFLCTDKGDMQKLIKILRDDMNLKVNVGYIEDATEVLFESEIPITEFNSNLGLFNYLIDVIDGPPPVLNYLCSIYNLHNTPIGDDRTSKHASKMPDDIQVFFSPNLRFNASISRYSNKKSITSSDIFPRNLLNTGVDQNMIDQELRNIDKLKQQGHKINNEKKQLQQKVETLEAAVNEIRQNKSALIGRIRNVKTLSDKFRRGQEELNKLKNTRINVDEERKRKKDNIDKIIESIAATNVKAIKAFESYRDAIIERCLAKKKLSVFDNSTGNVDEQIDLLKRDIANIEETCRRAGYTYEDVKRRMEKKEKEALELTDRLSPGDVRFKYTNKFLKLPGTADELQDKIDEMQGRMECIRGVDPQILVEYEERKEAIEELKHQLASEVEHAKTLETEIQALHNTWYPEIIRIVESINQNFSNFFAKMGFVGEVELIRKEERDYADYGIQIRVQYRDNEKLEALNRHIQSGGERAVAIAVYTLSLQHLTMVPFRCVDEINQGMDPKNERKIFQMLVEITCQPGQSQYFFITPKLLPDLPCHELMTVAIVYNGRYITDPFVFVPQEQNEAEVMEEVEEEEN